MVTRQEQSVSNNGAIEIENVSKAFKHIKALNSISLTIYQSEIFGLLGPNGSGKTTLLRILSTLVPADSSTSLSKDGRKCSILGHDLFSDRDSVRKIMGYVPQQDGLYSDLSALDNLILFSSSYDIEKRIGQERIDELLKLVGLYNRRHDLVRTFSGGMLKRLSIICALVHKPKVLFLDEVTVGLDTPLRREIWELLKQFKKDSTIVVTTHYVPDAENYCDRVALIFYGHLLDCGTPRELIEKYPPATSLEDVTLICQEKMEA